MNEGDTWSNYSARNLPLDDVAKLAGVVAEMRAERLRPLFVGETVFTRLRLEADFTPEVRGEDGSLVRPALVAGIPVYLVSYLAPDAAFRAAVDMPVLQEDVDEQLRLWSKTLVKNVDFKFDMGPDGDELAWMTRRYRRW